MQELLAALCESDYVLDLGCDAGSFDPALTKAKVVRLDLESHPSLPNAAFVRADAGRLPFRSGAFRAVISNHSMEHFPELDLVLSEVKRILQPGGGLYVAVPDASTLTDRLYRWLASGGGHVNAITSSAAFATRVAESTGLDWKDTLVLYSGLSFLNRRNARTRTPLRLELLGGGREWTLQLATYLFRLCDKVVNTRLSVYGWAFYFGFVSRFTTGPSANVCVRCGSGHSSEWLTSIGLV